MVDTAVLFISPSKRLLEGSEARVNAWNDSLGECLDTDQYATVYKEFELNFVVPKCTHVGTVRHAMYYHNKIVQPRIS